MMDGICARVARKRRISRRSAMLQSGSSLPPRLDTAHEQGLAVGGEAIVSIGVGEPGDHAKLAAGGWVPAPDRAVMAAVKTVPSAGETTRARIPSDGRTGGTPRGRWPHPRAVSPARRRSRRASCRRGRSTATGSTAGAREMVQLLAPRDVPEIDLGERGNRHVSPSPVSPRRGSTRPARMPGRSSPWARYARPAGPWSLGSLRGGLARLCAQPRGAPGRSSGHRSGWSRR